MFNSKIRSSGRWVSALPTWISWNVVFELSVAEINQQGKVLTNQQAKQQEFKEKFTELAMRVKKLAKLSEKK